VALEALRGDEPIQEVASRHEVQPNRVGTWKRQALDGLGSIFENGVGKSEDRQHAVRDLHAKIGEPTLQNDFLSRAPERRAGGREWR